MTEYLSNHENICGIDRRWPNLCFHLLVSLGNKSSFPESRNHTCILLHIFTTAWDGLHNSYEYILDGILPTYFIISGSWAAFEQYGRLDLILYVEARKWYKIQWFNLQVSSVLHCPFLDICPQPARRLKKLLIFCWFLFNYCGIPIQNGLKALRIKN